MPDVEVDCTTSALLLYFCFPSSLTSSILIYFGSPFPACSLTEICSLSLPLPLFTSPSLPLSPLSASPIVCCSRPTTSNTKESAAAAVG